MTIQPLTVVPSSDDQQQDAMLQRQILNEFLPVVDSEDQQSHVLDSLSIAIGVLE